MNFKYLLLIFILSLGVFISSLSILFSKVNNNPVMKISYLDVGQGDATLIQTPGGQKILIDVGPDGRVLNSISKELSFFEKDIDAVFITHADLDHAGGIISILDYFNVSNIFISTVAEDSELYDSMYKVLENYNDVVVREIDGGNEILIDEEYDVTLDVLFPIPDYPFDNRNDKSLFMKLNYGDTSFIFTGDASTDIEEYIVNNSYESLESNILKVGHHGSDTSTSSSFIKSTKSKYGIISSGKDNDYGHPHRSVIESLRVEGVEVLRTDKGGNLSVISDGKDILVK